MHTVKCFQVLNNNSIKYQSFVYTQLNVKTVLFQTIQFSISTQFSFIWPIDRTISRATTPSQNGLGSDGNKGEQRIPQTFNVTEVSLSDYLALYLRHLLARAYPFAEKQSPADLDHGTVSNCKGSFYKSNRYV